MFLDPERYWAGLCQRLGAPELIADARFSTADLRSKNGEALCPILSDIFAARPYAEWEQAFAGFDAPWELVQSIREVAADPQAAANGYTFEITVEDGTPVQVVAGPVSIDGSPVQAPGFRAPLLGEHTGEVLGALGLSDAEVERLRAAGAIQ
jgi:crotonobetainyl-CoA:carnitine CoA-transferase CaiB-like acyl-CoA transferase